MAEQHPPGAVKPRGPAAPSSVTADLLALAGPLSQALGHPRVRALHLPPAEAATHSAAPRRGEFAALELDSDHEGGALGLSYVLLGDTLSWLHQALQNRPVLGQRALDLAQGLNAKGPAHEGQRALAWAAVQALAHALMLRACWQPPLAHDPFATLTPGPGDHIGLVGLFGPLMQRLVSTGARITVLELRADWAGAQAGYRVTLDPADLHSCNKVLATGTLLLNDTLDDVLQHTRKAQQVALIGPTVSALPEPLFARGVHVVGGTWVQDSAAFVQALRQGDARGAAARKYTLTPAQWPGWQALLKG